MIFTNFVVDSLNEGENIFVCVGAAHIEKITSSKTVTEYEARWQVKW